jgi:cysteine desulfurase family protein
MIYFDNASTTLPKPPVVIQAVADAINSFGNHSRAGHEASLKSLRCMLETREAISELFCADNPGLVAFMPNATTALNIAINGIEGHIITTAAEHNSVLRPLHRRGNFTVVPLNSCGELDINHLSDAIKPQTEAIVMCHASNLTGNVFDIRAAGEICRDKGIKLIIDAAQTAGLIPVDMTDCGISALCFSGHKSLYGPQGTGGICLAPDYQPKPLIVGGSGSESFSPVHPSVLPDLLEAGTQNIHGLAGLLAGINYVNALDGRVFSEADRLSRMFVKNIKKLERIVLYGNLDAAIRTPVIALNIQGIDSAEVAALLSERYGIAVRSGAHCAPLMHETLNTSHIGAVRFSFSHLNTENEVNSAVLAIEEIIRSKKS